MSLTLDNHEQVWSAFRLPVPLIDDEDGSSTARSLPSYCTDEWIGRLASLLRLLHVMKQRRRAATVTSSTTMEEGVIASQIRLARSAMRRIERDFVPLLRQQRTAAGEEECRADVSVRIHMESLVDELRRDTDAVCTAHRRALDQLQSQRSLSDGIDDDGNNYLDYTDNQQRRRGRDCIDEIFLMDVKESPLFLESRYHRSEEKEGYLSSDRQEEEKDDSNNAIHRPLNKQQQQRTERPPSSKTNTAAAVDPSEFQKQQQHQLEIELSSLASRLKSSTLSIHSTLKHQTEELSQFETLAERNLTDVSETAEGVKRRVGEKKGWKKRLVTWSLIGTVVGVWIVCFVIMRTVPKRTVVGKFPFKMDSGGSVSSSDNGGGIRTWFKMQSSFLEQLSLPSFKGWQELLRSSGNEQDEPSRDDDDECEQDNDNCITDKMWEEQQRLQHEMLQQLQKEEKERWNEQREEEWKNARQRQRRECEISSDGTLRCFDGEENYEYYSGDRKAQEHAAERKRRRVEENMANAREVDAVDVEEEAASSRKGKEEAELRERLQQDRQDAAIRAAIEKRRLEEEEDARRHREEIRLQNEKEEARAAASAAEAKQRQEEAEQHHRREEQARLQREHQARAAAKEMQRKQEAEARKRREEEEQNRRLEEERRLENEAKAAAENEILKRQRDEEEAAAVLRRKEVQDGKQKEKYAAQVAAKQMEAAEKAEQARLQKEADDKAVLEREIEKRHRREMEEAAAEAERLEREHVEAMECEKQNIERVRMTASEAANAALVQAKQVAFDSSSDNNVPPSEIRFAAGRGKNELLAHYISTHPDKIDASDASGWRPIHEAARGGNLAGVQLLIDSGSDLSAKTGRSGSGGTALWWAIQRYGEDSDVVRLLRSYDAPDDGPEL